MFIVTWIMQVWLSIVFRLVFVIREILYDLQISDNECFNEVYVSEQF